MEARLLPIYHAPSLSWESGHLCQAINSLLFWNLPRSPSSLQLPVRAIQWLCRGTHSLRQEDLKHWPLSEVLGGERTGYL